MTFLIRYCCYSKQPLPQFLYRNPERACVISPHMKQIFQVNVNENQAVVEGMKSQECIECHLRARIEDTKRRIYILKETQKVVSLTCESVGVSGF